MTKVPSTILKASLRSIRLPLTGWEALAGQRDNDQWGPALAFEGIEAGVLRLAGSVLRDRELVEQARLTQAKLAELRRAAELEARATRLRSVAAEKVANRLEKADEHRQQSEATARERAEAAEAARRDEEQQARARHAERAKAAAALDKTRDARVAKTERSTRLRAVDVQTTALDVQQEAATAAATAAAVDAALAKKKTQRKSS